MSSTEENPATTGATVRRERFNRVLEIFSAALALAPDDRERKLNELCGGDLELKKEVELMLAADEGLEAPVRTLSGSGAIEGGEAAFDKLADLPRISGQYRLIRKLGEGGMGVVYLAEQSLPRRFVALKAIRAGLTSRQVLERFERETHILGRLHDPGIAQIYEAGVLDDDASGRAYIVMEYVDGATLTEFARQKGLSRRARIELHIKVCNAVHHAHLKRVIHRDLKPANVLVNQEGDPKILDFGIASLESEGMDQATITRDGQILGTPAYMSPEQVRGEDVDTRTDVYALGVMLFELLTSTLPHDLTGLSLVAALDRVRNQMPRRAATLDPTMEKNLDAVLSMALANDKSARYQSADALAADLQRYLNDEPVMARPESGMSILIRLLKRHRLIAAAAMLLIMILVASTLIFGDLSRRNALLASDAESARAKTAAKADELKRALYISRIGNAEAALAAGDTVKAKARLLECDESTRSWEWRHLWRSVDQSVEAVPLPTGGSIVAFNSSGTIAFVHRTNQPWVRLDLLSALANGKRATELGTGSDLIDANLSPDEKWIVCRRRDGGAELLRTEGSGPPRIIELRPRNVTHMPINEIKRITWLDEGHDFLCVVPDGKGHVFNVEQEQPLRVIESRPTTAYDIKRRPGRDEWMGTFEDRTVQLRSARDGKVILETKGLPAIPVSIGFSPDGDRAAIGCFDGTIVFWDLVQNEVRQLRGHSASIRTTVFSPDGNRVASGGRDRVVSVWDFKSGTLLSSQPGEDVRITALVWRGQNQIVSAGDGGPIRIFRADGPPSVPSHNCKGDTTIGSDTWKQWTAITMRSGEIQFLDNQKWETSQSIPSQSLLHARFSSSGALIASSPEGVLNFYSPERKLLGTCNELAGSPAYLTASSDRSQIAVLRFLKGVSFIDVAGMKIGKFVPYPDAQGCELLNDGTILVSRTHPDRLEVINAPAGRVTWSVATPAFISAFAVSDDQKTVAIGVSRKTIEIHEMDTGRKLRSIPIGTWEIGSFQFFEHDTRLAGSGQDQAVRVWSLSDGMEVATLNGHRSYVAGLMSCDNTESLISVDVAGTVRKWQSNVANVQQPSENPFTKSR